MRFLEIRSFARAMVLSLAILAALVFSADAEAQGSLSQSSMPPVTTGNNAGANTGGFCEIETASTPLKIYRIGVPVITAGVGDVEVRYRMGGWSTVYPPTGTGGSISVNQTGWTTVGSVATNFTAAATITQVPLDINVTVPPNTKLGLAWRVSTLTFTYSLTAPTLTDFVTHPATGMKINYAGASGSQNTTPGSSGLNPLNAPRAMPITVWFDLANSSWSGAVGDQWNTAGNWVGPIPSTQAETIIGPSSSWVVPTNVPRLPTSAPNALVSKITVQSGGSLYGQLGGGAITVREAFVVESGGTFTPFASTITMDAGAPVTVPLELELNGSSVNNLVVKSNTVVVGNFAMSAGGVLTIDPGVTLTFTGNANLSAAANIVNNGSMVFQATGAANVSFPSPTVLGAVTFSAPTAADSFTIGGNLQMAGAVFTGDGSLTFTGDVTTDIFDFQGASTYAMQGTLTCTNYIRVSGTGSYTITGLATSANNMLITAGSTSTGTLLGGLDAPGIDFLGDGMLTIGGNYSSPSTSIAISGSGAVLSVTGDLEVLSVAVGGSCNLSVQGTLTVSSYSQSTTGSVSVGGDAVVNGSMDMFSSGGLAIGGDLLLRGDIIDTATGAFTVAGSLVLNGTSAQNLNVAVHTLEAGSVDVQNPAGVILKGNYSASAALAVRVDQTASLRLDPGVSIRVGTTGTSGTVQVDGTLITITTGGTAPRLFGNAGTNEQGRLVVAATATANIDGLTLENFGPSSAPYAVELRGGSSVATFNGVSVSGSASTVAAILLDTTTFPRNVLGLSVTGTSPGNIDASTMPEFVPGLANVKLVISISKGVTTTVPDIYGIAHEIDPENVLSWENAPQLTIVTLSIPGATATVPYTASLSAIGGNQPVTWGLAVAPSWLSINPVTGELSGLPDLPHVGSSTVTVTASDTSLPPGIATKSFTLLVQSLVTVPLTITTESLTVALEGIAYGYTLTAAGGSGTYVWSVVSPAVLPSGLAFNGLTGEISGTPADGSAQRAVVTFRVTDNGGQGQSTERTLNLDIVGPLNDPDARDRLLNNPNDGGACSLPGRGSGLPWAVLGLLAVAALACTIRRGMATRP